jgi:hypothetical protein
MPIPDCISQLPSVVKGDVVRVFRLRRQEQTPEPALGHFGTTVPPKYRFAFAASDTAWRRAAGWLNSHPGKTVPGSAPTPCPQAGIFQPGRLTGRNPSGRLRARVGARIGVAPPRPAGGDPESGLVAPDPRRRRGSGRPRLLSAHRPSPEGPPGLAAHKSLPPAPRVRYNPHSLPASG